MSVRANEAGLVSTGNVAHPGARVRDGAGGRVLIVREATVEDVPRLLEMSEHFITSTVYADVLTFDADRLRELATSVIRIGVIFVAEIEGRLDGMLWAVSAPNLFTGEMYAEEIAWWVERTHRGLGIGDGLRQAFLAWAAAGRWPVRMTAPAGSDLGRVYERHGFVALETTYLKRW